VPNFDAELVKLYSVQTLLKEDAYLHAHSRNLAVIAARPALLNATRNSSKTLKLFLTGDADTLPMHVWFEC
jgi:hypothetical protein